jgi:hypothetical protein
MKTTKHHPTDKDRQRTANKKAGKLMSLHHHHHHHHHQKVYSLNIIA